MTDNILKSLNEYMEKNNTHTIKIESHEPFVFTITGRDEDIQRKTVELFGEAGFGAVCRSPSMVTFRHEPTVWQKVKSKIKSIW